MASWQAHLAAWIVKWRVKRKLRGVRDYKFARKVLTPPPYTVPNGTTISSTAVGGVPNELVAVSESSEEILLYLHGGGYFACSAQAYRPITVFFARAGFRVVAPDYRLAPEHPFPAAVDDAVAVYRGLLAEGHLPQKLVVSGDSAGGGLALGMLLALREARVPLPAAAAVFSPWTDMAVTGDSVRTNARRCAMFHRENIEAAARYYLGDGDRRTPTASPLYADLTGLPPFLIHVSANEVLRDDATRLAERARAAGVPVELKVWPVVPHAWQLAPHLIPEARESLRAAALFLHGATGANSSVKVASAK